MSITDELREWWLHKFPVMDKKLHDDFTAIADRIDEQHDKHALSEYVCGYNTGFDVASDEVEDADKLRERIEREYIKAPVDADGVPIEIGDYLHCDETGKDFPCRGYCCSVGKDGERRWTVECSYDSYSGTSEYVSARRCHHYHAPTVVDVLREFAEKITDSQIPNVHPTYEEAIAEYANRLRLAGDE